MPIRILVAHKGIGKSAALRMSYLENIANNVLSIWARPDDIINEHKYELPDIERLLLGMKPSHEMKKSEKPFVYDKERLVRKLECIMENGKFYFANNKERMYGG